MPETVIGEDFDVVLGAAQAGAEWAFSLLYGEYNPRLLRYLSAQASQHAEDLAADTWLGAARRLSSFRGGEDDLRAWLFTIAHHRLVQHWRDSARRGPEQALEDSRAILGGDVEEEAIGTLSAMDAARAIAAALAPDQAEVVLLRVLGGMSVDQVAEATGRRPGSVRVIQHRALRKLAHENFSLEVVTP